MAEICKDGYSVLAHWPKFRALAEMLGVPMDRKLHVDGKKVIHRNVRAVEFKLAFDEPVEVKLETYDGSPMQPLPDLIQERNSGFVAYRWPEFKEFALSFGFPWDAYVKWCSFRIAEGEQPTFTVCCAGTDSSAEESTAPEPKPDGYKYEKML